ncbi:hypothetical protein L1987_72132 [Smallanthus sonchifolius]|uniref:Uncharacterized protein n=1 Tax=Smallanthus sonchifolius TaxID=185202 RepID=A0ACB9AW17_9ASTR|nr:hypothetical protein L1987_72132 [Smallanthus sonchifolius]
MGSPNIWSKELGNLEKDGDKKRELDHNLLVGASQSSKRRKHVENGNSFYRWPQFAINSRFKDSGYGFNEENISKGDNTYTIQGMSNSLHLSATSQMVSNFGGDSLEEQWYASPEDSRERCSTLASNVYSLGVLLFELFGSFQSARAHAMAMMDLRQRILPPSYLSENPKEAGFCLWDILQSEPMRAIQQSSMKQFSSTISHEDTESDLMLDFLVSLKEQKQKNATKLVEDITCLESDISEIESRRPNNTSTFHESEENVPNQETPLILGGKLKFSSLSGSRLINSINHLEHAYFAYGKCAVEMPNKSKLSSICWNSYIRNYLASTDYDGVVKIWDAGTGEAISHHIEHERRAWSVDFSRVDPIKLASGSDDCSVKLWSINEKKSLATIKTAANVCCVQFSPYSTHLLSFGSADYRTYCYDLRNVSTPMCTLSGHGRAVSYVKFLDCGTLVSASTDNTLKLWDLNKADFGSLSTSSCILTFKETNEVYPDQKLLWQNIKRLWQEEALFDHRLWQQASPASFVISILSPTTLAVGIAGKGHAGRHSFVQGTQVRRF